MAAERQRQKELAKKLGVSEERVAEFREAFDLFDQDASGHINARELENCMKAFGLEVTTEQVEKMIADTDRDGSGEIDFEEYVGMMTAKMSTGSSDEDLLKVFHKTFDPTGKGKITKADLMKVCETVGENISEADLAEMIRVADKNGDNAVDAQEFVNLLQGKNNMFEDDD